MLNDPDLELVEKAQAGDKAAYGELCKKYFDMVYSLAYGVLHNREESLDTAQEVLIKVHRDIVKFKKDSKFKTWLYRVSINGAIDMARKRKPNDPLENAFDLQSPERLNPRSKAAESELQSTMKQAVAQLSPEHRAVLVLREWQGLSYEEIAESLNLEMGTVMSRLYYARKSLAKVIKSQFSEVLK